MSPSAHTSEIEQANATQAGDLRSSLRQMFEALICLAVAVVLVRTFQVEGYMISTGSMAPTLAGFHKRVTCPSCGWEFPVGADVHGSPGRNSTSISFPRRPASANATSRANSGNGQRDDAAQHAASRELAVCPNCGRHSIDISALPLNQGDQLLVHKNAYEFNSPRRWEVIVFRNPARPTQAYVKRVAGLPGEEVNIVGGDLFINGRIQRKQFARQLAMRIPVYDHAFEPHNDPDWQSRWIPLGAKSAWERNGQSFVHQAKTDATDAVGGKPSWLVYRHWIRDGGRHKTTVPVSAAVRQLDLSSPSLFPLKYDAEAGEFSHRGVLTSRSRDRIAATIDNPAFVKAIHKLSAESHLSPVLDDYGYNRTHGDRQPTPVRDLMISADVRLIGDKGRFLLQMTDGIDRFTFSLDVGTRDMALTVNDQSQPVRQARLLASVLDSSLHLEMSLFDRQVIVAINGKPLFAPFLLDPVPPRSLFPRKPVRFGAAELRVRIGSLKLYRDIYYTQKGAKGTYKLGPDQFFVLGDNSPISADSRVWDDKGVHRRLFLGKPFLVHLPSKPGRIRIGGTNIHIRIPDVSRIRYIR
ncbi:MAG: signal peptidase I [Planctomycetes bacterium]|nr:signal peptidase I [Planctomycetota bacterium]